MLCGGDSPKPCGGDGSASWIPPMSLAGRVPRQPPGRPRFRLLPSPSLMACLRRSPRFPRQGGFMGGSMGECKGGGVHVAVPVGLFGPP